jgi:four helix bundle protein
MIDFHKLDVYRAAASFLSVASSLAQRLDPEGGAGLGERLRRAAVNIPLCIADGSARMPRDERAARECFGQARLAALEAAALLDTLASTGAISEDDRARAHGFLDRVITLLARMAADGG